MIPYQAVKMADDVPVGMGQSVLAREPARLTTILGSCVAVTLYSPRLRLGMLSHVVLPQSKGNKENPSKFADTAIPYMISTLKNQGVGLSTLTAKIVGGACMFGNAKVAQIGENNIHAVVEALETAGLPIVGRDVSGTSGRRICFDLASGSITVACVGCPPRNV